MKRSHQNVCLSLFQLSLAFLSISFFTFFFYSQMVELRTTEGSIEGVPLSELFHHLQDAIDVERSFMVSLSLGRNSSLGLTWGEVCGDTDLKWGKFKKSLGMTSLQPEIVDQIEGIEEMRKGVKEGNVTGGDVCSFYLKLSEAFYASWVNDCLGTVEGINNAVMSDYFRTQTMHSLGTEKDMLLILFSQNHTGPKRQYLKTEALKQATFQEVLLASTLHFSSPNLQLFYKDLTKDPLYSKSLIEFKAMRRFINTALLPSQVEMRGYERACDTLLFMINEGDDLQEDPDISALLASFVIAGIGMGIQVVVTGYLSFNAIEKIVLLNKKQKRPTTSAPEK
eukprot:TRINITY_DN7994_c0_g1_i3.p1 TRINITY_DN7994_c0_g1~~TRINITY_DN7994_c0_g1_i3.p1  ORF type:complete len:338 (-),score=76.95 TRINITY_DN7994_c0_g1_i3:59-1072(-)